MQSKVRFGLVFAQYLKRFTIYNYLMVCWVRWMNQIVASNFEWNSSKILDFRRTKCLDFGKKSPACVHLWIKFSFKMQFYQYFWEKQQTFSCFFCMSYMKRLTKCPYSKKPKPSHRVPCCPPGFRPCHNTGYYIIECLP